MLNRESSVSRSAGFTLIELVVVIAVIAIALPVVQAAREVSRRTQGRNNLQQFDLAFHGFHETARQLPPAYVAVRRSILPGFLGVPGNYDDANIHTYGEFLLPFLEQGSVYRRIDFTQPDFSPVDLSAKGLPHYQADNQAAVAVALSVFLCPSAPRSANPHEFIWTDLGIPVTLRSGDTDFGPSSGIQTGSPLLNFAPPQGGVARGALSNDQLNAKFRDITDGTSSTALMWEIAGRPDLYRFGMKVGQTSGGGWADVLNAENWFNGASADGSTSGALCAINCTNAAETGVYSFHPAGVNVLLCDGSVRFLNESSSIDIFVSLVTLQGGTPVNVGDE